MAAFDVAGDIAGEDLDEVEFVASGGSGTVYRAVQRSLGRVVALKVLHGIDLRDARTSREARVQAEMSWHANVITLYGTTTLSGGSTGLVMEFAPGGSLTDRIARTGPLDPDAALRLGRELSSALAAAHAAGIVHRDVKPSNVLFATDGSSRLADFGISGSVTRTLDEVEASVAYAAPELLEGDQPSPPNDVYALALTLLVAASGRHPFGEDAPVAALAARIQSERIRFSDHVADWPAGAVELMDRCLNLEPDERPTAAEVSEGLRLGTPDHVWTDQSARPRRRAATAWVGAFVIACLAGTVLVASRWAPDRRLSIADFCDAHSTFERRRIDLFNEVSADLERSASPVEVVERLLVRYPQEWSGAVRQLLEVGGSANVFTVDVTDQQLRDLAIVDALQALNGGRVHLTGTTPVGSLSSFPGDLRLPAGSLRDATSVATERCGSGDSELVPARDRMYSAVYSSLADQLFMERFFADERSYELIDPRLVELMLASSRPFVEALVSEHRDWLLELLVRSHGVRQAISTAAPDLIFAAGESNQDRVAELFTPEWCLDLRIGLDRVGPISEEGIRSTYPRSFAAFESGLLASGGSR